MNEKLRKNIKILLWLLILCTAILIFRTGFLYFRYYAVDKDYFGDSYTQSLHLTDIRDYFIAKGVLRDAETAFTTFTTAEQAEEDFGAWKRYCVTDRDAVTEKHSLRLIAADITEDTGTLWVSYYQAGYDENGDVTSASGNRSFFGRILSCWKVKKNDVGWEVVSIKEHP